MKNSVKLVFAASILLSFAASAVVFWYSNITHGGYTETAYQAAIDGARTSNDFESIREFLLQKLESEKAMAKAGPGILNYLACVILGIGVLNAVILFTLLRPKP